MGEEQVGLLVSCQRSCRRGAVGRLAIGKRQDEKLTERVKVLSNQRRQNSEADCRMSSHEERRLSHQRATGTWCAALRRLHSGASRVFTRNRARGVVDHGTAIEVAKATYREVQLSREKWSGSKLEIGRE